MAMTEEQRADAIQALKAKVRGPCPLCGKYAFEVADLAHVIPHDPSGAIVLGPTIPLVMVMCKHCNLVLPFAAVPMGVMKAGEGQGEMQP
ncbi:MAG: hypothetical protein HY720_19420 [Planctomycetes bacterium]|nr:hypothetical protein [Planctomycetota bacterium]